MGLYADDVESAAARVRDLRGTLAATTDEFGTSLRAAAEFRDQLETSLHDLRKVIPQMASVLEQGTAILAGLKEALAFSNAAIAEAGTVIASLQDLGLELGGEAMSRRRDEN